MHTMKEPYFTSTRAATNMYAYTVHDGGLTDGYISGYDQTREQTHFTGRTASRCQSCYRPQTHPGSQCTFALQELFAQDGTVPKQQHYDTG